MSTTTGKQAAAAAKTLLADRIALVGNPRCCPGHPPPRRGSRHHRPHRRRHRSPTRPRRLRHREDRRMDRSRTHQSRPPRTEPRPHPQEQKHQTVARHHRIRHTCRRQGRRDQCRMTIAAAGPDE